MRASSQNSSQKFLKEVGQWEGKTIDVAHRLWREHINSRPEEGIGWMLEANLKILRQALIQHSYYSERFQSKENKPNKVY